MCSGLLWARWDDSLACEALTYGPDLRTWHHKTLGTNLEIQQPPFRSTLQLSYYPVLSFWMMCASISQREVKFCWICSSSRPYGNKWIRKPDRQIDGPTSHLFSAMSPKRVRLLLIVCVCVKLKSSTIHLNQDRVLIYCQLHFSLTLLLATNTQTNDKTTSKLQLKTTTTYLFNQMSYLSDIDSHLLCAVGKKKRSSKSL